MHQNLHSVTLDMFNDHSRLWWQLDGRQCMAEVSSLTARTALDLGQSGWLVFEKTYNQHDERLMYHAFRVVQPELLAEYLKIDLFDLNYLTS